MKQNIITIISFILVSVAALGQIGGKKSKAGIIILDSIEVKPGDTIYLGQGTDRRGDFVYIYQPANVLIGSPETSLPRQYNGVQMVIKHFKDQSTKRFGKKTVAVVNPGGLNFVADITAAIEAKEIVAINQRRFDKPVSLSVSSPPQQLSIADELKKLKDLLDSGALTQSEYDLAKKKLLEKE